MNLFLATVWKWQDLRDSSNRISAKESATGRLFILNTNRITDIKDLSTLTESRCSFLYADNPSDRRESVSYLEVAYSQAQMETIIDSTPHSQALTLPFQPKREPWGSPVFPLRTPVDTTIGIWAVTYFTEYNPDPDNYCWLCYYKGAFKRIEVLVNYSLDDIIDIVETGTTTSTSTTTTETREQ